MKYISLREVAEVFNLELMAGRRDLENIKITSAEINRPGLHLHGYKECFGNERIQVLGLGEITFLANLSPEERTRSLTSFYELGFPCVIVARGLELTSEMLQIADDFGYPILRTDRVTTEFTGMLISYLYNALAPSIDFYGVLVEVYGEGILLEGESGIGKSEIALELVKRGHRLVADDMVQLKKLSATALIGSAPEITRHMIEIRGIGVLDVKNMYGVSSVKPSEKVDLVVHFEPWVEGRTYDRLGVESKFTEILGVKVPCHTIPVSPGRNLAIIIEAAAINSRQKKMGYNAAAELARRTEQAAKALETR